MNKSPLPSNILTSPQTQSQLVPNPENLISDEYEERTHLVEHGSEDAAFVPEPWKRAATSEVNCSKREVNEANGRKKGEIMVWW